MRLISDILSQKQANSLCSMLNVGYIRQEGHDG